MTIEPILTTAGWLERYAQLAVRQGVHLSTLHQKDGRDLELVFATASLFFPADRLLDERGANAVLKEFLATAGDGSGAVWASDDGTAWAPDTRFTAGGDASVDEWHLAATTDTAVALGARRDTHELRGLVSVRE